MTIRLRHDIEGHHPCANVVLWQGIAQGLRMTHAVLQAHDDGLRRGMGRNLARDLGRGCGFHADKYQISLLKHLRAVVQVQRARRKRDIKTRKIAQPQTAIAQGIKDAGTAEKADALSCVGKQTTDKTANRTRARDHDARTLGRAISQGTSA
jgi:hypothetical protein